MYVCLLCAKPHVHRRAWAVTATPRKMVLGCGRTVRGGSARRTTRAHDSTRPVLTAASMRTTRWHPAVGRTSRAVVCGSPVRLSVRCRYQPAVLVQVTLAAATRTASPHATARPRRRSGSRSQEVSASASTPPSQLLGGYQTVRSVSALSCTSCPSRVSSHARTAPLVLYVSHVDRRVSCMLLCSMCQMWSMVYAS